MKTETKELLDAAKKMVELLNNIRVHELSGWSGKARDVLLETRPVIEKMEDLARSGL